MMVMKRLSLIARTFHTWKVLADREAQLHEPFIYAGGKAGSLLQET